jgi:hypothetical protein
MKNAGHVAGKTILTTGVAALSFIRVEPASSNANPACMKNTSINAKNVKAVFSPALRISRNVKKPNIRGSGLHEKKVVSCIIGHADGSGFCKSRLHEKHKYKCQERKGRV